MIASGLTIAVILSLQTLCTCIVYTLGQYIYAYYLHAYPYLFSSTNDILDITLPTYLLNINSKFPEKCIKDNIEVNPIAQAWAQKRSADLFFWCNLTSCIPIIVMTYILGLQTSRLGKRFVLLLPMIGTAIQLAIWLAIIYFHLPEYWWYIAAFIVGLSGSDNVRNFVLNLFITETTDESERSTQFVLFGAVSMIVSAIGTFIIGYYIAWKGFTDLYWAALILQISSILIVLFFCKATITSSRILSTSSEMNTFLNTTSSQVTRRYSRSSVNMFSMLDTTVRSRKKNLSLFLTLFTYASYSFICTAYTILLLYLLNAPFCWTSEHIGNFSSIALISLGILSVIGMRVLTKVGASDITICIVSHLFLSASFFWIAYAEYDWQMYVGLIISSFSSYQNLLTLSIISKWLEDYERSNVFTLVTALNTIMKVTGFCVFNWIYAHTVISQKNFAFLLAGFLSTIPLISNICLWYVSRWMSDESNDVCDTDELYSPNVSLSSNWSAPIGDGQPLLLPQKLTSLSRSNSPVPKRSTSTKT